ncbi:MAG: YihY/virulence factor BrkB family protein [Bacteroidetes bacterium]|nr:YihY/virulence factor BrkB family protein [Bacteroidota bacterium]
MISNVKNIWHLLKDAAIAWDDDNIGEHGAALSFFTMLSLSPLLIIVVVLSSVGFGREAANGHLVSQIRGLIGTDGATFVQGLISNAYRADANLSAAAFGIIMLLLGATGVFIQLRDSLNMIWRVRQKPRGAIRGFVRVRLLSFAMILGIGFLLLVSLTISAVMSAASVYISGHFSILAGLVTLTEVLISFAGITVVFVLLFKFLPAVILRWRDAWVGAAFTSILFSIGKYLIGLYLGNGMMGTTFGAASSLVIIMMWTYYSSQIILYGAEFTRFYALRYGTEIVPSANGIRITEQ